MRLFIAGDFPDEVKKKLVTLQNKIGNEYARIKWVEPENIHLTLKFLGDVEDGKVEEIVKSLEKIKFESFTASLSEFGVFPSESYVRVLWVGLEPGEKIVELHDRIDAALSDQGFKSESRFQPHVTLGRVKSVRNKEEFLKLVRELKNMKIEGNFEMNNFKLKKSTLTRQGPIYEDVTIFELIKLR